MMETMETGKEYVLNRETGKIELHFSKNEYQALSEAQKADLKRHFLFSGKLSAWVSRSVNNHYSAIQTANKLGFCDGGKVGERLSYAEQLERKAEKAEARAERFEQYADNAERRAEGLQNEFNELRQDWSWLTQPNINSSRGRAFTNQRNKVLAKYEKGFKEYRKSQYFKDKAITASETASQAQLQNKTYLNNRIEECNKNIRAIENNIVVAEERNNSEWLESLLEKMEYEIDKLAFFQNCMDDLGGVQYNKDNVKAGYLVKIRGSWDTVVKANTKTIEVKPSVVPYTLKYAYADIQDIKIPEGWSEPKPDKVINPFICGDIVVSYNVMGNWIIKAYQIVKTTDKSVMIQEVQIVDGQPVADSFKSDKQERKAVKKDRNGIPMVDYFRKHTEKKEVVKV